MMQYKVVYGYAITFQEAFQNIEGEVNQLLQAGWKPLGNLSVIDKRNGYHLAYQAMVK